MNHKRKFRFFIAVLFQFFCFAVPFGTIYMIMSSGLKDKQANKTDFPTVFLDLCSEQSVRSNICNFLYNLT